MEIEIAEQLKLKLENEFKQKIAIFENLTGLKVADVDIQRVYNIGGGSELNYLRIRVEMD